MTTDVDDEVLTPDGVTGPGAAPAVAEPGTDLATTQAGTVDAMAAAAQHAAGDLGMAEMAEFATLCVQARMFALSELAPKALRGKPYDMLLVLMTARDLGIPPTAAMRKVSVIEGQTSLDTQLLCALVRREGLGSVVPHELNNEAGWTDEHGMAMSAVALAPNGQPMGPPVTFSWFDAVEAGYVDPECRPGAHATRRIQKGNKSWTGCACKSNWRNNPRDMLYWRAAARACRFYFPEAGIGMYSADEIQRFTGTDSSVDPMTAPLPDGWTDPGEEQRQRETETQERREAPADPHALWRLQELVLALPEGARQTLMAQWIGEESNLAPYSLRPGMSKALLPARLVRNAEAMVNAHWANAKRDGGVDQDREVAALRRRLWPILSWALGAWAGSATTAAERPVAAPDGDAGPEAPEEAPAPSDALPDQPEFHDGNEGDDEAPAVDWTLALRQTADEVAAITSDVPEEAQEAVGRILAWVKAAHHTRINELVDPEWLPAPIDLRRMRATLHLIDHFVATGELPQDRGDDAPG